MVEKQLCILGKNSAFVTYVLWCFCTSALERAVLFSQAKDKTAKKLLCENPGDVTAVLVWLKTGSPSGLVLDLLLLTEACMDHPSYSFLCDTLYYWAEFAMVFCLLVVISLFLWVQGRHPSSFMPIIRRVGWFSITRCAIHGLECLTYNLPVIFFKVVFKRNRFYGYNSEF